MLVSIEAEGSWAGSYAEALEALSRKLQGWSMRELKESKAQGWDRPVGLLDRWLRDEEITATCLSLER